MRSDQNSTSGNSGFTPYEWQRAILASDLPSTTKLVLMALSTHLNKETGLAFPSIRMLMKEASLGSEAVVKHIGDAKKAGWIEIGNHGYQDQRWARKSYTPRIPVNLKEGVSPSKTPYDMKGVSPSKTRQVEGVSIEREGVSIEREGVSIEPPPQEAEIALEPAPAVAYSDSPAAPNNILTIKEQDPPLPPKGGNVRGQVINGKRGTLTPELKAEFELFYEAYPRKQGRQAAIKAWGKLNPDAGTTAEIMRAIELQKQSEQWQQENGHFIPYPATWLNGRRWEDQLTPPTTRTRRFVV
jgi:Helix-turn-helix domain